MSQRQRVFSYVVILDGQVRNRDEPLQQETLTIQTNSSGVPREMGDSEKTDTALLRHWGAFSHVPCRTQSNLLGQRGQERATLGGKNTLKHASVFRSRACPQNGAKVRKPAQHSTPERHCRWRRGCRQFSPACLRIPLPCSDHQADTRRRQTLSRRICRHPSRSCL